MTQTQTTRYNRYDCVECGRSIFGPKQTTYRGGLVQYWTHNGNVKFSVSPSTQSYYYGHRIEYKSEPLDRSVLGCSICDNCIGEMIETGELIMAT